MPAASLQTDTATPPFYLVRIKVKDDELAKQGKQRLRPGMPAEVFIERGSRSALSYLLEPFADALPKVWRGE